MAITARIKGKSISSVIIISSSIGI